MGKLIRRDHVLAVLALVALGFAGTAQAGSGTWTTDGDGLWSDATNWSGGTVADAAGSTADFSTIDITADRTVHLDFSRTLGNVIFGDTAAATPASWTLDNNGNSFNTLTLSGGTGITVNALGTGKGATISANVGLVGGTTTANVAAGGSLTLAGTVTTSAAGTTLEKIGSGALNVSGQLFNSGDVNSKKPHIGLKAGTLNLANNTVSVSRFFTGYGGVNTNVTATNSTITVSGEADNGDLTIGFNANATACCDMRGGSLAIIWGGIYQASSGGGVKSIITLDNNPTVNFQPSAGDSTSYSEWRMGDNGAQGGGGTQVVMRSGTINFSQHSYIDVGVNGGVNVFNQLGGAISIPKDEPVVFNGTSGALNLAYRMNTASNYGLYNLNGGTLTAGAITSGDGTPNLSGNRAHFNFHGGTLIPASSEANFIRTTITGSNAASAAPQPIVYSEGAVIDTAGKDITIQQPLLAPAGQGVANGTIAISGSNQGSGYRATPLVLVNSGSGDTAGVTATAVANMVDDGSGNGTLKIASITITNPGINYTAAPTLTASGGDPATVAVLPALTIAANVSGGLTKKGNGTLTLAAANTYRGPTWLGAGVLNLSHSGALQYSTLTMNGGAVAFDSSVAGDAFTVGGLAAASAGAGYDITLQNNGGSPVALTVGGNNANTTYAAVLSGSGSIIKTGSAALALTANSTYDGTTTVQAGVLEFNSIKNSGTGPGSGASALGWPRTASGQIDLATATSPATLRFIGNNDGTNRVVNLLGNGTIDASGTSHSDPLALNGAVTGSGDLTLTGSGLGEIDGNVSTSGALTKQGPGTWTLSGSNGYTGGTSVNAGTLNIASAESLPPGGNLTITSGGHVVLASGLSHAISLGGLTIASGAGASFGAGLPTPPASRAWSGDPASTALAGSPAAPTPEPSTLMLLAAGGAAGMAVGRRTRRRT